MAIRTSSQMEKISSPGLTVRQRWIGILRIVFGLIWAVAASLKWRPEFINNFAAILKGSMDGQPQLVNQ